MFLLKKIISPFFYPLTLCLILMICGLFLLCFTKRQKSGRILVSVGVIFMAALSYGPISDCLLRPLERTFPPLLAEKLHGPVPFEQKVKWIVVLGGGHASDPGLPVTGQISFESLARLTEAVRLYRSLPGTKLILSGGAVFDPVSNARIYFKTARIMDVPARDLVLSEHARDTAEEARFIQEMVGRDPMILVTSAFHMPRAMALFKKQGMNPIPAPAAHLINEKPHLAPGDFFPSAWNLHKAQTAVHEYIGIAWSKLRGRI
jgi:uncharacterized SAM-binding protein YcdF (DUF218 family)